MARMRVMVTATAIAALAGVVLPACGSSVDEMLRPCNDQQYHEKEGLVATGNMNGIWKVDQINGVFKPSMQPAPLPGRTDIQLYEASLTFYTTDPYFSDDCKELLRSKGIADFHYEIVTLPSGVYSSGDDGGRFERDHKQPTMTLSSKGQSGSVTVTQSGTTRFISANVPIKGTTYTLRFREGGF